jgi:peroxiredoxin
LPRQARKIKSSADWTVYGTFRELLVIAIVIALWLTAPVCGDQVAPAQLSLLDLAGKRVNPLKDSSARAVVFIFTRADCPVSNRYAPEVRRLSEKFAPGGVKFWLVYPDPDAPASALRQHVEQYRYGCDALRDPRHELVKATGVSVTPEAAVFVLKRSGARLVYRGRIDDQYVALGKQRPAPTTHDLEDVLNTVVKGEAIKFRTTVAVGCYISDLNQYRER